MKNDLRSTPVGKTDKGDFVDVVAEEDTAEDTEADEGCGGLRTSCVVERWRTPWTASLHTLC
jgi:hypothetical protein